uniref:Putative secreted peptide n=1 Tax=Anopheles braziliensis TaxID=58242 RepID=A0A2M3ZUH9_9DIPT
MDWFSIAGLAVEAFVGLCRSALGTKSQHTVSLVPFPPFTVTLSSDRQGHYGQRLTRRLSKEACGHTQPVGPTLSGAS